MTIKRLDLYIELEKNLLILRTHFELCAGAKASEVLDWAKFFHQWSKATAQQGGPWSKQNLLKADRLVNQLSQPKAGLDAFTALQTLMAEASESIREEIMGYSQSMNKVLSA